jgi:beta-lactamase regulating signal transducer with metallopeptidase domain
MTFIIGLAIKSLVAAGLTLGLLRLFHNASAAQRSWLAHAGLGALLLLPLVATLMPALEIETGLLGTEARLDRVSPAAAAPAAHIAHSIGDTATVAAADPVNNTLAQIDWALLLYLVPAALLLGVTLVALVRLFALRSRAQVMTNPAWLSALAHAQARMNFKNGTALLVSDALPSPVSWGLARPVILLNQGALDATDEAEAIIAHELAHVTSMDWAKLLLGRVVTALYWFNPLVWLLVRDAHQLREEAADDAVLAADVAGPDYAALLVHTARHDCRAAMLAAHGVAPGKGSLQRRVHRVLDHSLPRTRMEARWATIGAVVALFGGAPLAALTLVPHRPAEAAEPRMAAATPIPAAALSPRTVKMPQAETADAAPTNNSAPERIEVPQHRRRAAADPIEDMIAARAIGLSPDYAAAIRSASPALAGATSHDLSAMRSVGVTPDYVRALARSGYRRLDPETIVQIRSVGLSPAFIGSLAAAGLNDLSVEDLTGLASVGVDARDVRALRASGQKVTVDNLERYGALKGHVPRPPGVPADAGFPFDR